MSKFCYRLRELRNSRKMTQQELADALKLSKSSVNMYERGQREPSLDTQELIADYFNVDMDYLLGISNEPRKSGLIPQAPPLTKDEKQLLDYFRGFNDEGQDKLLNEAYDMSQLDRYKKESAKSGVAQEKKQA